MGAIEIDGCEAGRMDAEGMATTAHSFDPKLPGCQSGSAESVSHCRNVNLLIFFFFSIEIIC